jgi:hypothetical protein
VSRTHVVLWGSSTGDDQTAMGKFSKPDFMLKEPMLAPVI